MCSISQSDFLLSAYNMSLSDSLSVELTLEIKQEILAILDEILSLKGRAPASARRHRYWELFRNLTRWRSWR